MTRDIEVDYRAIFEQKPSSCLLLSTDFVIIAASDSYLRDTMTDRERILGRLMFDVFPDNPNDAEATGVQNLRRSLQRAVAERTTDTMALQKYDIPRPDGGFDERYWSPVNSPVLSPSGEVLHLIHQVTDVTEFVNLRQSSEAGLPPDLDERATQMQEEILRRTEEVREVNLQLRASEERFRLLSSATADAIWDRDLVHDEIWLSDGWSDLLGVPMAQLRDLAAVRRHLHPDDRARVLDHIDASLSRGDAEWSLEFRLIDAAERTLWVEGRGRIIRDEHERPIRMVGGLKNLTAGKEAELRLERQAALLDKASDAIVVRTLDDRITFWSAGAEQLYGWSADEVLGREDITLRQLSTDTYDAATTFVLEHETWFGELTHRTKDGRSILVEARWTLLHDSAGEPEGVLVINTDITQRRKLENELMRGQRMDSLGAMASGIAHDLNNVLAPILLSIELLRKHTESPKASGYLDLLEASATRGADLVAQVLSFARGTEGRRDAVDPCTLVDGVIKLVTEAFPKSIEVSLHCDPDTVPDIRGDATQLQQVVLNICLNAEAAMPDGGKLQLDLQPVMVDDHYASMSAEATPGEYVVIEVTDTGSGIDAQVLPRIFEPFFTTKPVGHGTGLGLATSHTIVKDHGGFVTVYSEPGVGTTFKVYLPTESSRASAPHKTPPRTVTHAGRLATILLADDEDALREITRDALEDAGYHVLTAVNGAEAVAVFEVQAQDIDLILTDMMMPIMDGNALIDAVKRIDPNVCIVALSGLAHRAEETEGTSPVAAFLQKPYTAAALLEVVHQVLEDLPARPAGS